jgi:hypothetical protein
MTIRYPDSGDARRQQLSSSFTLPEFLGTLAPFMIGFVVISDAIAWTVNERLNWLGVIGSFVAAFAFTWLYFHYRRRYD